MEQVCYISRCQSAIADATARRSVAYLLCAYLLYKLAIALAAG